MSSDSGTSTATMFAPLEEYENFLSKKDRFEKDNDFESLRKLQEDFDKFEKAFKYNFRMESGKVKLSTVHSYKGWSVGTEILVLDNNPSLNDEMVYTAITRAKNNLIIVNIGNEKYHKFFSDHLK